MRIIDRFSEEHQQFVGELDRLKEHVETGGDVDRAIVAARALATPLLRHAENEEALLFPDLIERLGRTSSPVTVLQEEHVILHGQIDRLTAEPTAEDFAKVFAAFDRILREHILKEEDVVFPMSAELLGDTRLREMDEEITAAV